ncbi:MAG: hypothetical protein M3Y24_04050, partial [Acidobacteriota bacterium]|nr:hypothetical protein [Acidobacteriota bacterium]
MRGIVLEKHPNELIVEAAGVGYNVQIPISTYTRLPDVGAAVSLRIHTHVREDGWYAGLEFSARTSLELQRKGDVV